MLVGIPDYALEISPHTDLTAFPNLLPLQRCAGISDDSV